MKNNGGRLVIIILSLMCIIYLCALRFSYEKSDKSLMSKDTKPYVAVITKSTQSAYWKTTFAGAKAAGAEYNLELSFQGPEREEDFKTQNEMIHEAVEKGAKVIVFSAVDYHDNAEAINRAIDKDAKVVVIDSDVESEKVSCRISTDNYKAGQMVADALLKGEDKKLKVGIVNFDVNTENGQKREQGFRDSVAMANNVEIVSSINVNSTIDDAKEGTIAMLEENPQINAIVTFNEWTSLGVGYAIRELKLKDKAKVVAFDSNIISVGMLETGEVDALIVQNPYAMGYLGVEYAAKLINGDKIEKDTIDTTTTLITRENMFTPDNQKVLFSFE
ncbi:MAG: substrate-binding domain-containing protein [Lachnospiraceae bacterium]|nr:substrate-binding domain-containing protein [Lachnospiraceae bacterium]